MKTIIARVLETLKTNGEYDRFKIATFHFVITFSMLLIYGQYLLYFDKSPVVSMNNILLLTKSVVPGNHLVYSVDFCKNYDLHGTVAYQWENDYSYSGIASNEHLPVGCHNKNIVVHVPEFLPSGQYMLEIEYLHKVNILATRETVVEIGPFLIE